MMNPRRGHAQGKSLGKLSVELVHRGQATNGAEACKHFEA